MAASFTQQLLTPVRGSAKMNPGSREGWRGHREQGGSGWAASGSQPCWAKSHPNGASQNTVFTLTGFLISGTGG